MFEPRFSIIFLDDALFFLAHNKNDPGIFKKLRDDIWEIRTFYMGLQYRVLAFWDKSKPEDTLVIATHGFIKKQHKVPAKEISKAVKLRALFFEN